MTKPRTVKRAGSARDAAGKSPVVAFEVELPLTTDLAVARVADGLKAEGFGIITRIDAHTVFEEKLGVTFRPYTILGACNPKLAHEALSARPEVGLLLPCNITVESAGPERSLVRVLDPAAMLALGGLEADPKVVALMKEARERLERVVGELRAHANTVAL